MPRSRRSWIPELGAHIVSRFVDRRFFITDELDRRAFLDAIARANCRWDWKWLSYAMMSSHVHYGHVSGHIDPDRFFRSAHTRFAKAYHRRRDMRTLGPVFADRPKIYPVSQKRLCRLVAYHHRNPVDAGVVQRARDSTWTSHRAYLRLDPAPSWLDVERALSLLGFNDTESGRRHFDEFVMEIAFDTWTDTDKPAPRPDAMLTRGPAYVNWERLLTIARDIAGLPRHEPIGSRRRGAARARLLTALFATQDLAQTYASVATPLGVRTGSVFNLLARTTIKDDIDAQLHELRHRWHQRA